jgi:8-oxo-dGTP diphosphatase
MDNVDDSYFQVSVKGLFFNGENKLMLMHEKSGYWDLPGGRIQKGENFIAALQREVEEETGLVCKVLEKLPSIVYPAIDLEGRGRIMVFFKVMFDSLEFKPSEECIDIKFFTKDEIKKLKTYPQFQQLAEYL